MQAARSIGSLLRGSRVPMSRPLKLPTSPARVRAENKALWNEGRTCTGADFFTIGYEGRATAELLDSLRSADVRSLLDIRHTPVSMYRPELSKWNFAKLLAQEGISYVHFPEWGVPKPIRAMAIEAGTREPIWEWIDEHV